MEEIFIFLTRAVAGTPVSALAAAGTWGLLSILLSPCHLASIPLIVAFVHGHRAVGRRRALALSSLFALGILVTIALIGAATAAAGRMLGDLGGWGNYLVAAIFFVIGLHLLGLLPLPWSGPQAERLGGGGPWGALLLGMIFGLALGPCTFAFMAPVLGVVFGVAATSPAYALGLLGAYGLGHCSVLVLAGTCTGALQRYLHWNERSKGALHLRRACGVLVLGAGFYLIYTVI